MRLHQALRAPRGARVLAVPPRAAAVLAVLALFALAGCGERGGTATQTAAKVDKGEITVHQINFILQQQRGLRPEQADTAGRQVLERLIDQELAVQKADVLDLDRDPRVLQALEAARREVLARAYADKVAEGAAKPTPEDVSRYYAEKPELFSQRRIYNLQELVVQGTPGQIGALREYLAKAGSPAEVIAYLRGSGQRFTVHQAVRAAEQLPLPLLARLAGMKDGQAALVSSPQGAQVLLLLGSRIESMNEEQARPVVEQFLLNDRKRQLVEADRKALRAAAKIEYFGAFAQGAAPAASAAEAAEAPPATPLADPPALAAPGPASAAVGADDVARGLGVGR